VSVPGAQKPRVNQTGPERLLPNELTAVPLSVALPLVTEAVIMLRGHRPPPRPGRRHPERRAFHLRHRRERSGELHLDRHRRRVASLTGHQPGDTIADIFNGAQRGNFGWLTWAGGNGVPALIASLTPPGNSNT